MRLLHNLQMFIERFVLKLFLIILLYGVFAVTYIIASRIVGDVDLAMSIVFFLPPLLYWIYLHLSDPGNDDNVLASVLLLLCVIFVPMMIMDWDVKFLQYRRK